MGPWVSTLSGVVGLNDGAYMIGTCDIDSEIQFYSGGKYETKLQTCDFGREIQSHPRWSLRLDTKQGRGLAFITRFLGDFALGGFH